MKSKEHRIIQVNKGSVAEEMGIEPGDILLSIDDKEIEDIFDYQFLSESESLTILIRKADGEEWLLEIDKDEDEDLGLVFDGLMDEYRSCHNKCIFCFIDQMPKGMRPTLYFKDDDSRLSFLQGNYVTLTNMSDHDIDRILHYHLSPINISFQTMNPQLRCMMLNNRFAGEALKKVDRLYEGGITMNGQIVLCKGVNDGKELEYSINELMKYAPLLESVSVVPVGLTKFRDGLYPLESFNKEDALETIRIIESYQKICFERFGIHFIHASDEFYILADQDVPEEDRYDGYLQYENGVGMVRFMLTEFGEALTQAKKKYAGKSYKRRSLSMATGRLIFPHIQKMMQQIEEAFPGITIHVYPIRNDFFGEKITVSGLITGQDLLAQLKDVELGEELYIPQSMLRSGEDVFLDDVRLGELSEGLHVPVGIVKSSDIAFIEQILIGDL